MLFCQEINSIELDDNGNIFSITRGELIENILGGCKILTLNERDGNKDNIRRFLFININESNSKLTERFNIERNLRI